MSIDWATPASSDSRNADGGDKRDAIGGETVIIEKEYRAPKGEVTDSKRCDIDISNAHPAPAASEKIDANKLRESEHPDVNEVEVDI